MGLLDFLKAKEYKEQISNLEFQIFQLNQILAETKGLELSEVNKLIESRKADLAAIENQMSLIQNDITNHQNTLNDLQSQISVVSEEIEMETYGLYKPRYDFVKSTHYKNKLDEIRRIQKQMIKDKTAVYYFDNWVVNGSRAKGVTMTNQNIRQILRSFNSECEAAINKVRFSNIDSIKKRIERSFTQINNMNKANQVSITPQYLDLKFEELYLAYEYEKKKQEERELLREEREREREERKLQREIKEKQKIIEKDIKHFQNMRLELMDKLKSSTDPSEKDSIEQEINNLTKSIENKEAEKEDLDYRSAHANAGYVYIISNIGSFGENFYKIGVTRRLDPYERISELSSASVPFRFDVHAMIFSYEAYDLEAKLHQHFSSQRVNLVNNRKEFFKISLEDIKSVLDKYKDLTIDFTEIPEAEEYRNTLKIRELEANQEQSTAYTTEEYQQI